MFKLFKKKSQEEKSTSGRYFSMKIKEVRKETEDTSTLIFEIPEKGLAYQPGQFLTLILPIEGKEVRRSYSLCTSPYLNENPAITVKRIDTGLISNYLNDHMKPGDSFDVMAPAGHFTPVLDPEQAKKYILLAGGSGITPIMSILKSILHKEQNSDVTLVYQSRNKESIIFREQLDELAEKYAGQFKLIHILSQPNDTWKGYRGRIDHALASDILMDIAGNKVAEYEFFLCGPAGFMLTVFETLMDFEVPEKQIHKESFYSGEAKPKEESEAQEESSDGTMVTIVLDGEEYEVNVPPNKSILEAALDENIDMPFSCQSGLCTACRGKLLEGSVTMEEDDGLSEEELNEGYVLNCVGHPDGPGVKIEIG
jgi:ring-1,2-phenylacetyl-CoA epoxidase subunit PaaE